MWGLYVSCFHWPKNECSIKTSSQCCVCTLSWVKDFSSHKLLTNCPEYIKNKTDECWSTGQGLWLSVRSTCAICVEFPLIGNVNSLTPVLQYLNPTLCTPLTLQCDALKSGLNSLKAQNGQPVTCISRALEETVKMYTQTEEDVLAVSTQFTFGWPVDFQSEEKPLGSILTKPQPSA